MPPNLQLILASSSPRRKQLLEESGYQFEIIPSPAEEIHDASIPLEQLVTKNAILKAEAVAKQHQKSVVIGADTLVYIDETPLGKPKNLEEAKATLTKLAGRKHQVCTGVSIISAKKTESFSEVTDVYFKPLTEKEIDHYLETVPVLDKAGSYAIQEKGTWIIDHIEGEKANVMGLPQKKVQHALLQHGIKPTLD